MKDFLSILSIATAVKQAFAKSKSYTDTKVAALPKSINWKGSVDYYSSLPANPNEGDAYTVRYRGTSGTMVDGREYAYGKDATTSSYAWIELGPSNVVVNSATGDYSVTLEGNSSARRCATNTGANSTADGYKATAYGCDAQATAEEALAIGYNAEATAQGAIQIGNGTNNEAGTVNIGGSKLLDGNGKIPFDRLPLDSTPTSGSSNTVTSGGVYTALVDKVSLYVSALVISEPPTKTAYTAGDVFDPSGMVVDAEYSTKALRTVTNYTYSPSGALAATDTAITVSYTESGRTVTATVPIVVDGVYGVVWDYGNSSTALTRLTAATDPNGYVTQTVTGTPSPAVGTGAGSSPFDTLYPWSAMDEYNIVNSEITHRKGEDGFSRSLHDTMVYIPEFYYKVTDDSTNSKRYFYLAPKAKTGFAKHPGSGRYVGRYNTIAGYASKTGAAPLVSLTRAAARTGSHAKGDKWYQYDYASWCAVWFLYLMEFSDWDSQTKIGQGLIHLSSASNVGATDAMVYHTGRMGAGTTAVQYRHIENPWGNVRDWIDGINMNDRAVYVCTDPSKYADETTTDYTATGVTLSETDGLITNIGYSSDAEYAFLPTSADGSTSTYIPDKVWSGTGWRVLSIGGAYEVTAVGTAGLFAFGASSGPGGTVVSTGTRLLFVP